MFFFIMQKLWNLSKIRLHKKKLSTKMKFKTVTEFINRIASSCLQIQNKLTLHPSNKY